jgi:hypothetical protein
MVVEILEQLAVFDESLLKPSAVNGTDIIRRPGLPLALALDFAHREQSTWAVRDLPCGQAS